MQVEHEDEPNEEHVVDLARVEDSALARVESSTTETIAVAEPEEDLDDLERQLAASLVEVRRKKEAKLQAEREAAALAKLTKPITVRVMSFDGAMVVLHSEWRQDLQDFWQTIPGRMFRGMAQNAIPMKAWIKTVEAELLSMPNISVEYAAGVAEMIDFQLNSPVWFVELEKRNLKLVPGPRYNTWDVRSIPGISWNAEKKFFTLPLSEAWRLYESLSKVEGVLYSDEAKEFTMKQVEMRGSLDAIGAAKDWEYEVALKNGVTLRPIQRVGCAFVEASGGRTLMAYQMGLGKTIMGLAYAIKNNLKTLVVCPASLKNNWAREIYRLTGEKPVVLQGAEPGNHDLITLLTSEHRYYIINYDIVGRKAEFDKITKDQEGFDHVEHCVKYLWADVLNMAKFDLVLGDEAHYIKNTDSNRSQAVRQLKAPQCILMTGTPVLNRPGELWPLLTMLAPDTFPSEDTFVKQYTYDGKVARNVAELKEALKPIMIRRKQSDAVDELPPLNRIEDYHELGKKAKKLYRKIEEGVWEAIAEYSNTGTHGGEMGIASILAKIMRLKQVCAIDKVDSTADLAIQLHESAEGEKHNKVLIFTQFKACAYAIAQRLGHEALCFVSRGTSEFRTADNNERDALVQQFQTDPKIKYLVVTEKTAKEGHNITEAGFVVFNDLFWTPAAHEQGEGRAYMRINDPHGITAYYRIVDDEGGCEIEQWIWELLKMKATMIESTVEGVEAARDTSVAMALIQKMKDSMWSRK